MTVTAPWELIEAFSRFPRWQPEAVNAAAEMIADRLRRLNVPVTVHAPEIYLSIPLDASVEADGQTFRAKPPSMSVSVAQMCGAFGPSQSYGSFRNASAISGVAK